MNVVDVIQNFESTKRPKARPVLRYERKLSIPIVHFSALKHHLYRRMTPDPNNSDQGYTIQSLYFDTSDYKLYYEKHDGQYRRLKARLRFYESHWTKTFPELKIKIGDLGYKRRSSCSFESRFLRPGRLMAHIHRRMNDFGPFAQSVMDLGLGPTCWINYRRYAFWQAVGSLRVTIDFDIRAAHPWRRKHTVRCFSPSHFVLEIKYADRLPNWVRMLTGKLDKQPMAISKYGMGLNALIGAYNNYV